MLTNGSQLLDRFRIQQVLGTGGFAVTYLAVDEGLQKRFAIKEYFPSDFAIANGAQISSKSGSESEFKWGLDRFLEEARILARFHHPNIVGVNQIFEANGTAYIVLEYQSGTSLKTWLEQLDSPPDQTEFDFIVTPLLNALEVMHKNNVLHRDIAPDNIYIRDDGSPVLLDFGSAREALAVRANTVTATIKDGFSPIEQYSTAYAHKWFKEYMALANTAGN
jgi:serine/threonine protein kinase